MKEKKNTRRSRRNREKKKCDLDLLACYTILTMKREEQKGKFRVRLERNKCWLVIP